MIRRAVLLATLVAGALLGVAGVSAVQAQTPSGTFAATPTFSANGQAAVVFLGGSVDQLEAAARTSTASGVWAQDGSGAFRLLVVGGPVFLRSEFTAKFPNGFSGATAVTLTRPLGVTATPPPIVTSTPTPLPPTSFPTGLPGPSSN